MSEFFDAHICKCPICKTKFASCEGPLCDCFADEDQEEEDENKENSRR